MYCFRSPGCFHHPYLFFMYWYCCEGEIPVAGISLTNSHDVQDYHQPAALTELTPRVAHRYEYRPLSEFSIVLCVRKYGI